MNISKTIVISFCLFFCSFVYANELLYVPKVIEINEVNLDIVQSLKEDAKSIKPPLKTREIGSQIFKNIAPTTALIATENTFGSGFLIDDNGHVISNYHVVQNQNDSFHSTVNLLFCPTSGDDINDQIVYQADVVKVDPQRDLALLKINSVISLNSPSIDTKNESVEIGMDVHAIGHPEGAFCTYTKGVVSQIRKGHEWSYSENSNHKATVIQTQTPINPGNSGGPLINDSGLIIGINTFKHPEATGINFAVSSSEIDNFIKYGAIVAEPEISTECDFDIPIEEVDYDENGVKDLFYFDTDCNDVVDTFGYDEDEDGLIDLYLIDNNESGTPNVRLDFDTTDSGEAFARYYYDEDEDGNYDEVCFDTDLDNEIDECRSTS